MFGWPQEFGHHDAGILHVHISFILVAYEVPTGATIITTYWVGRGGEYPLLEGCILIVCADAFYATTACICSTSAHV